jgi:hypothetical protein
VRYLVAACVRRRLARLLRVAGSAGSALHTDVRERWIRQSLVLRAVHWMLALAFRAE